MHGRKRAQREENDPPEIREMKREKYKQYLLGCKLALSSEENAGKAEKILRFNPDFFTLWNSRRRVILAELESNNGEDVEKRRTLLEKELQLTKEQISERNSKSYGAWYQRRWAIEMLGFLENGEVICDLQSELALCDMLLLRDERNFHCWAHRNLVAEMAKIPVEEDLEKSHKLIEKNFSNYSAWHLRVQAIGKIGLDHLEISKEFELVHQAVFTEPADQSAWLYFRWLLAKCDNAEVVGEQVEVIKSLLDEEGDCKWPLLAMLQLYAKLRRDEKEVTLGLCDRIQKVDQGHSAFYKYITELFDAGDFDKLNKVLFSSSK